MILIESKPSAGEQYIVEFSVFGFQLGLQVHVAFESAYNQRHPDHSSVVWLNNGICFLVF